MNNQKIVAHSYQEYLAKFFWTLAPLMWGLIIYFLAYGPAAHLRISNSLRLCLGIIVLSYYFYRPLEFARHHIMVFFFNNPVRLPNWGLFVGLTTFLLLIYSLFFTWGTYPLVDSVVLGVFGSACLEELLSRTVFITYRMKPLEFIFFNILSSCAFTLMHAGYEAAIPSLYELFFVRGHFQFSFLLGLIAYKTQRIEIPMMIHMVSNLVGYTLPVVAFHQELPLVALIFACFQLVVVSSLSDTPNYIFKKD